MATVSAPYGGISREPTGMPWRDLFVDTIRSPLAQALLLAAALGTFLVTFGATLGWRDTFRGAPLGFQRAPDFSLVDQHGQPVSMESLSGGAVVLTFIYTNCTYDCPLTTAKLVQTMDLLGSSARTARVVAITVDPARDDQATLRAYAERFHVADRFHFLTGPTEQVMAAVTAFHAQPIAEAAARAVSSADEHAGHGLSAPLPRPQEISHPSVVLLIDADGNERFAYGPGFEPEDLAHDIELLQRDLVGPTVPFSLE